MARSSGIRLHCAAVISFMLLLITLSEAAKSKDERECEVCIGVLKKIKDSLPEEELKKTDRTEKAIRKQCKLFPKGGKENRFCYFIGGTEDAATGILGEISRPLSFFMPVEKICQKLKTKDSQICELRYDVKPDFSKLNKMRVGELKKILSSWNEDNACKGCAEKSDFVKKVKELLPKYEPEEYKKLQEKSEL